MKSISHFLSDSVIHAFGWTLVHSIWQGALLSLLATACFYIWRHHSASMRYNIGVAMLSLQVFASVLTFAYYNFLMSASSPAQLSAAASYPSAASVFKNSYELPVLLKIQFWFTAHIQELVICWLIGACLLVLRFASGWIFTERLRRKASLVMDKEWRSRFGILTAKLNISQSVELKQTARILTPMVIGAFRPVVLIPVGLLSGFSVAQVEAILAHELAHIRRNDYLVNMMQSVVEVLFFFHPAIWWLSEKIRIEREHCCDDIAITVSGDRVSLAHALVKVAEWQTSHGFAMAFASRKPLLLYRVRRVLGLTPKPVRMFGNLPVMLLAAGLVLGISYYAVAQQDDKSKGKKTSKIIKARKAPVAQQDQMDEEEIEVEIEQVEAITEINDNIVEVRIDPDFQFDFDNDSLNKKMGEFHRKMQVFQAEMEPLRRRMEELNLEMEKQRFEVERFERNIESIEWKKEQAVELRSDLMEKRSSLFDRDSKTGKSKLNETDIDKQVADFEQQIKAQEQSISELNTQIASSRKEALKAEEPVRKVEQEMEDLSTKIEEISHKKEMESREVQKYAPVPPPPPPAPRAPRAARSNMQKGKVAPPPPPAVPVKPAKPLVR